MNGGFSIDHDTKMAVSLSPSNFVNQTVQLYRLSRDPGEIFARRPKFHL